MAEITATLLWKQFFSPSRKGTEILTTLLRIHGVRHLMRNNRVLTTWPQYWRKLHLMPEVSQSFHLSISPQICPYLTRLRQGIFSFRAEMTLTSKFVFGFTEGMKVSTKWNHYNLSVPYPKGKYIQRFFASYIVIPLQKVNGDLLQV